jgi:hypothetical protein
MMQHGDLRSAAFIESPSSSPAQFAVCEVFVAPAFNQRKFAACEVFGCCIILPIQGKASRLIRSEGRLR